MERRRLIKPAQIAARIRFVTNTAGFVGECVARHFYDNLAINTPASLPAGMPAKCLVVI